MTGRIRKTAVGLLTVCSVALGTSSMLGTRAMAAPAAPQHRFSPGGTQALVCNLSVPDHRFGPVPDSHTWGAPDDRGVAPKGHSWA